MSELILVVCVGLNAYWVSRTLLLLRGSAEEINAKLEGDLWLARRVLTALRHTLFPMNGRLGV